MFCSKCGAEIQATDRFCSKCGSPNDSYQASASTSITQPTASTYAYSTNAATPAPEAKATVNVIGLAAAVIGMISLFFPFVTASFMGYSESIHFIEWMDESDTVFMTVITFISFAWILLFHLTRHPKLTLVGCLGLAFTSIILFVAFDEMKNYMGNMVKMGFGFWMFLIASVLCLITAFMKTKKQ